MTQNETGHTGANAERQADALAHEQIDGEADTQSGMTEDQLREIEQKFDSEVRFRPLSPVLSWFAAILLFALAVYHYYTAGFGIPRATNHMGLHLAFTLVLIYLSFAAFGRGSDRSSILAPLGLPLIDWAFAIAGAVSAYYVAWIYNDLAFRVGNPFTIDVVMGTILIALLLEATRRAMGWPLPVIALLFISYAYFGRSMPGVLQHPGADWTGIVNHLYLTSQGIYGTALIVISTYVFHFVLFGVLATKIGLGQLFIDLASALAGRFSGGPAKVSVLSSAMLGSISGSSIANTVTTGSLTIPAMIKIGYPRHFAAAVEAASSTGGQITPPVMGAVAFLMIEYLGVPLTTILTAALVPAFHALLRRARAGPSGGQAAGLARPHQGGATGCLGRLQAGLADAAAAHHPRHHPPLRPHALQRRLLGHHVLHPGRLRPDAAGQGRPDEPDQSAGPQGHVRRLRTWREILALRHGGGSARGRHHRRRHPHRSRLQDRPSPSPRRRPAGRKGRMRFSASCPSS